MLAAQREAEEARSRFAETIECLPEGVALYDADDRLVACNGRFRTLLPGLADRTVPGVRFEDLLREAVAAGLIADAADAAGDAEAWIAARLAHHRAAERPFEMRLADGRWLRCDERPTADGGRVGVHTDITEAKRREADLAALAQRNTLLVAAVEASPNAVVITDATVAEPVILYVNPAFEALTGHAAAAVTGRPVHLLYGPDTDPAAAADLRAVKGDGGTVTAELLNYRKDGSAFRNRVRMAPVKDRQGRVVAHVSVLWDVTAERDREAEERQRQKLEALGQLAGGIAHEINNLLQPVVSLAGLNLRHPADPEVLRTDLSEILDCARQCREVVGAVLAFARRETTATAPLLLDEAVRAALSFVRRALPPSVTVEDAVAVTGAAALVGRTELTQVLTNLLTNAADAMDGRGTVTVALEAAGEPAAPAWRLSVRDRGCGMDAAEQQRVFEPFYTTKGPGKGTGLGLSMVHGIVRSWGGSITVESARGQGTTVAVMIPRVPAITA
ncbi:PAS domain-containing sensor histidine kinase [Azospirillum sp. A39]|uniref:PAS domain-containing sensor histidine kinase n=1 Tax=Azospirillum sp. A39 TaxID=3462279 RepID=UPI004045DDE3